MKTDSIEQTAEYKAIEDELEKKIIAKVGEMDGMGYCYKYWQAKKEILKSDYNMDWKSPAELNPHIMFD